MIETVRKKPGVSKSLKKEAKDLSMLNFDDLPTEDEWLELQSKYYEC